MLEAGVLPPCCDRARFMEGIFIVEDREKDCPGCPVAPKCVENRSICVRLLHEGHIYGYLAVALPCGMNVDEEEQGLFTEMAGDIAYALHVLRLERERLVSVQKQKVLEDQLIQSQKMESVGRLAGGVAHDFNNQLSVIIGHTELAMSQVEPSQPLFDDLTEIRQAARRSADLTRQLLAFARRQTITPKVLDLNETVEGMLKMLRRLIGEDIELAWKPGADLWPVLMDPVQLDQILANLCVNARDAIAGVGKISIETKKASIDEEYCAENAGAIPGDFAVIIVADKGCGMEGETLARIFEPFFTTKSLGKGTGLGLSTVYGIVRQNRGFVEVDSEPGRGSEFRIFLPRRQEAPVRASEPAETSAGRGRGETLLLVEDETAILNMAKRILASQGYSVLATGSPDEALELARAHSGEIRLLITDVVMPEMNGKDLADEVKTYYPEIKVLFMSGYTADVIAVRGVLDNGVNFIQKPFSMQNLLQKVRAALDKTA
ncbi:MAG: response regulator [Deltaproteobacteria bacterium]|nr:response regulator [Deltaproteobacteria bacterium]